MYFNLNNADSTVKDKETDGLITGKFCRLNNNKKKDLKVDVGMHFKNFSG